MSSNPSRYHSPYPNPGANDDGISSSTGMNNNNDDVDHRNYRIGTPMTASSGFERSTAAARDVGNSDPQEMSFSQANGSAATLEKAERQQQSTVESQPHMVPPTRISHELIEKQLEAEALKMANFNSDNNEVQERLREKGMPSLKPPERVLSWTSEADENDVSTSIGIEKDSDHEETSTTAAPTFSSMTSPISCDDGNYDASFRHKQRRNRWKVSRSRARSMQATDDAHQQMDTSQRHNETDSHVGNMASSSNNLSNSIQEESLQSGANGSLETDPDPPGGQTRNVVQRWLAAIATRSPEVHQSRPGAFAVPGFLAHEAGTQDSNRQQTSPTSVDETDTSDDPLQNTVVADAVTTDDLENQLRSEIRDEIQAEAVTAEVVVSTEVPFWKRKSTFFLGIVALLAVIGGVVGIVYARAEKSSPAVLPPTDAPSVNNKTETPNVGTSWPTAAPTADPATISTIALVEGNSFDGGLALKDPSSPQFKSLQWLLGNKNLGTYGDDQVLQRFTLATFYYSTNGQGWLNSRSWLNDSHECQWHNILCNEDEFVTSLEFNSNNLVGTLPPELALLSGSILRLELEENLLSGLIPTEFGLLRRLEMLELPGNGLSSSIPSELGLLTGLESLLLAKNNLNGYFPSQIGNLSNLSWLWLDNNEVSGTLPTEIGRVTNLQNLLLHNNKLTGTVPTEINRITTLNSLYLFGNRLTPPFSCRSFITNCWISCGNPSTSCRQL